MKTLRQWSLSVLMVLLSISMLLPGQVQTVAANETDSSQTVEQITAAAGREKLNFNQGWKFVRANIPEAVQIDYPQSELERWENVDLPHPVRLEEYNASGGKNYQGEAMYRKHFYLDESYAGKKLYFEFEGAMGVTDVWVNGTHLQCPLAKLTGSEDGNHTQYGGYLPFVLDITDAVHCDGEKNVITVLTDNRDNGLVPPGKPQGSLDFSYFGGIYRNVYLHSVESVHITDATYENIEAGGGILIDYPSVSEQEATAVVKTHVRNETDADKQVTLKSTYVDPQGKEALSQSSTVTISASDAQTIAQNFKFENPQLWDLDHPNLYTLVSTVTVDGEEVDRTETTTGIRTVIFSATEGVKINGKHPGFLSGVNRHQEYPYIGYAASDNLQRKDAILYKNAGFQIVRTAHHAQSPAFLEECDRLGILVVEAIQGWQYWNDNPVFAERVKNDTRQMIRRDRNHPCIFAFETSLNESTGVPAGFTNSLEEIAKSEGPSVRTAVEAYDDSTKGDIVWGRPEELKNDTSQSFIREYGDFWLEQYGNFTDTCRVTRGPGTYYPGGEERMVEQANNRLYNGFHFEGTGAISLAEGKKLYTDSNKRMAGMTMWIGIDHNRGYDPTISACGIWDLFRLPKYSYNAFASQRPVEHDTDMEAKGIETGEMIFIASTRSKTAPVKDKDNNNSKPLGTDESRIIYVYSNLSKVKLEVISETTGKVLWTATQNPMNSGNAQYLDHPPFLFENVPYSQGSYLKATGLDADGNASASQDLHTAGAPAKIILEADTTGIDFKANGSDQIMVYAKVIDANGTLCQEATNELRFTISGEGTLTGDGDRRIGANPIQAEAGQTGIYVKSTKTYGDITVRCESEGLETGSVTFSTSKFEEKCVPYEDIPMGIPFDQGSMYLTQKDLIYSDERANDPVKESVTIDGNTYDHTLRTVNGSPLSVDLAGNYVTLSGKLALKDPSLCPNGAIFKMYGDGVLLYVSPVVKDRVEDFSVQLHNAQTLTLLAEDSKAGDPITPCWLDAYLLAGTEEADDSELRQNLARNKTVTASHTAEGSSAELAVDGNSLTSWESANVPTEENPESFIVDLGETINVRNARLGFQYDYLRSDYSIYTSADGKDWTFQCSNQKTAHASQQLDLFQASGVRYVKAEFKDVQSSQGETGGSARHVFLTDFEIYKDLGVSDIKDYNLAGFEIAGVDAAFDSSKLEYTVSPAFDGPYYVRALPANRESSITINGKAYTFGAAFTLDKAPYAECTPDENGQIQFTVSSPDQKGQKTYTVHVLEPEYAVYDSAIAKAEGVNGAYGWSYGTYISGNFEAFDSSTGTRNRGEYVYSNGNMNDWIFSGPRYIHPGTSVDTARRFTAPKDGNVLLHFSAEKFREQPGDVGLQITLNGEKIWPLDESWKYLYNGSKLTWNASLSLKEDDEIVFALGSNGSNGGDATFMQSTIEYTDEYFVGTSDYLSDLEWKSAESGDSGNTVRRDKSCGDNAIRLNNGGSAATYEKGVGSHADSTIILDLSGKNYSRFISDVGIDYEVEPSDPENCPDVDFIAYGDGKELGRVSHVTYVSGIKTIDVDVKNVKELKLVVSTNLNQNYFGHVDWAGARLVHDSPEALDITVDTKDRGTVTGLPARIYPNTSITLNAVPNAHYHFVGWMKAGESTYLSENAEYTFTAAEDLALEAVFEGDPLTITVNTPAGGTVTGLPETVRYGDSITLSAAPTEHFAFAGWKKSGSTGYLSTEASYTFTAAENMILEAVFEADTVTITVKTPQNGTVTGLPETIHYGDSITLKAAASEHYRFAGWKKAGEDTYLSTDANYTFVAAENLQLEAVFEQIPVQITLKTPQNGTVTGLPASIHHGDSIILKAKADENYHFVGWKVEGSEEFLSTSAEYTFTALENRTLEAVFEADVIYTPDWTLLDQVITKSNSVFKQKDSYREANWTAFENELNRAKDLRKNSKVEQDAINAQSASLNQALLKLRKTPSASLIR